MNKVKVKASDLLEKLLTNRATHSDDFKKAFEGYRLAVIAELEKMLDDATKGKTIPTRINLDEPVDHTGDYDRVISMLQMSIEPTVELSSSEFQTYVLDQWTWKEVEVAKFSRYTSR